MGAFDWSSVVSQTGQTISDSRSAAFGGARRRHPGRDERAESREDGDPDHETAPSIALRSSARSLCPVHGPGERADDTTLTVDHERLREAGDAVSADRIAGPVVDEREGEPEAVGEAAGVGAEVLGVDAEHDNAAIAIRLPDLLEERGLLLARPTP